MPKCLLIVKYIMLSSKTTRIEIDNCRYLMIIDLGIVKTCCVFTYNTQIYLYFELINNRNVIIIVVFQCQLPNEKLNNLEEGSESLLEQQPVQDLNWKSPKGLGQISGVTIDQTGRPVIFHRGDHIWNYELV